MPPITRRFLIVVCCTLFFLCALPLSYRHLAHFIYWTSLMSWPGYDPLLYHFPIFFDTHAHVWATALLVASFALGAVSLLMRHSAVRAVVLVVACPIFAALAVQYAAITRLDDHVFWFFRKGIVRGLPWEFDSSALLACLTISIIYTAIALALILAVRSFERYLPKRPNHTSEVVRQGFE